MQSDVLTGGRELSLAEWSKKAGIGEPLAKSLWEAIDEPDEVPYMMEGLLDGFSKLKKPAKEALRNGLMRVQIHCSIHGNSDPIKLSKQLFVSQVVERLFFGNNKLMAEGLEEHEDSG